MIATFVRNTCSSRYYRLQEPWPDARGRGLAMIIISYNNNRKGLLSPKIRETMPMRKMVLALLLAASVTPVLAQEKNFELKISHWVPASHPLQKSLEEWGAAVEKASGGTIKSQVFPAQQLGKAFDHYD